MKRFLDFLVLIIISFFSCLILYLALLDKRHKPSTFKQWTFEYFVR